MYRVIGGERFMKHQKRGAEAHHTTSRYAEIIARWVIGIYSIATILTLFTWIISPLRRGHGLSLIHI